MKTFGKSLVLNLLILSLGLLLPAGPSLASKGSVGLKVGKKAGELLNDASQAKRTFSELVEAYDPLPLTDDFEKFLGRKNSAWFDLTEEAMQGRYNNLRGRESERAAAIEFHTGGGGGNLMVTGAAGVGKSTLPKMFARDLIEKNASIPPGLRRDRVLIVNLGNALGGKTEAEQIEYVNDLLDHLDRNPHVHLVLDEFGLLTHQSNGELPVIDYLKSRLDDPRGRKVWATQTDKDFTKMNKQDDGQIARRFGKVINLTPPTDEETFEQAWPILKDFADKNRIRFRPGLIKIAIKLAKDHKPHMAPPGNVIELMKDGLKKAIFESVAEPARVRAIDIEMNHKQSRLSLIEDEKGKFYAEERRELSKDLDELRSEKARLLQAYAGNQKWLQDLEEFTGVFDSSAKDLRKIMEEFSETEQISPQALKQAVDSVIAFVKSKAEMPTELYLPENFPMAKLEEYAGPVEQVQPDDISIISNLINDFEGYVEFNYQQTANRIGYASLGEATEDHLVRSLIEETGKEESLIKRSVDAKAFHDAMLTTMKKDVVGYDEELEYLARKEFGFLKGLSNNGAKMIVDLVGEPGGGKNTIVEAYVKATGAKLITYNGSDLRQGHEVAAVRDGPAPGYVGFGEVRTVDDEVEAAGGGPAALMLDELNLGHHSLGAIAMQAANDGAERIARSTGTTVSYRNVAIFRAGNFLEGRMDEILEELKDLSLEERSEKLKEILGEEYKEYYTGPLRRRIDLVIGVGSLDKSLVRATLKTMWVKEQKKLMETSGIKLVLGDSVLDWADGYFDGTNAGALGKRLANIVQTSVGDAMLDGNLPDGSLVEAGIEFVDRNGVEVPQMRLSVTAYDGDTAQDFNYEIRGAMNRAMVQNRERLYKDILGNSNVFSSPAIEELSQSLLEAFKEDIIFDSLRDINQKLLDNYFLLKLQTDADQAINLELTRENMNLWVRYLDDLVIKLEEAKAEVDEIGGVAAAANTGLQDNAWLEFAQSIENDFLASVEAMMREGGN